MTDDPFADIIDDDQAGLTDAQVEWRLQRTLAVISDAKTLDTNIPPATDATPAVAAAITAAAKSSKQIIVFTAKDLGELSPTRARGVALRYTRSDYTPGPRKSGST